MSGEGADWLQF